MTAFRRKIFLTAFALICAVTFTSVSAKTTTPTTDPVDYVNVLIGTMSKFELSAGNTYPAIARPWGMNFWTPQTGDMGNGWTYVYTADKIRGIKQTHQPSPWINDYGQFSIMPVTNGAGFEENKRASWFTHKAEEATPYYYGVYLADHDVYTEVSPTERAAVFQMTFPEREESYIVIDAFDRGSYVKIMPDEKTIIGFTTRNSGGIVGFYPNYFIIKSDTPFTFAETVSDGVQSKALETKSKHSMAVVGFATKKGQKVTLKVASSFMSFEQAEQNLNEVASKTFDEVKAEGRAQWNETLGRIKVEDSNIDNLRTFYSCLYRAVLFPRDLSEVNKAGERWYHSPYDGKEHQGYMFADTGFWDTFRSLFPLMNLVYPEESAKVQEGLLNAFKESGFLPEWSSPGHRDCMVGNNSASVVADAFVSGITSKEVAEGLWKAVTHGAHADLPHSSSGRDGWQDYDRLGYVPCDIGMNETAARTLEYAYDDWTIYHFGKALGKSEKEIAPYKKAAMNYRNIYNSEYSLMVGRKKDGSFNLPFNPLKWGGDFTEGNSLHYTWSVFHDPAGLIKLMGGDDKFGANLDNIFTMPPTYDESGYGGIIHEIREMQVMNMGNYAHGNQPAQHMIYLYDWCGMPWKAQARVREVMDKFYSYGPDGYCGDEDNGQTSAWYVFSAMGFYPVCPASCEYAVGSPLFDKVSVTMPNGKEVTIKSVDNSKENCYISSMKINGKETSKTFVTLDQLRSGCSMLFQMSSEPNTNRGKEKADRPYSLSEE